MAALLGSLTPNGRAVVWTLLTVAAFSGNNVALKYLGRELDPVQILFVRSLFMMAMIAPFAWHSRAFATRRLGGHFLRGILGTSGAYLFIFALTLAPLTDVIALSFSRALFIVLLAAVILGEAVRWRRGTAVIAGFCGVLVMVRPGFGELNWGIVAATTDAVLSAGVALTLKSLGRTERPQTVVFYFGLFAMLFSVVPALLVWRAPGPEAWLLLAACGVLATLGQVFNTRAWTEGDASIVAPLTYLQLIVSGILDALIFAVLPDRFTVLGAAIIVGATLYIALREARLRQAKPPAPA